MPSRADWEAATPKCPRAVQIGERCGQPCRWSMARERWLCPAHGVVLSGADLAAMRQTVRAA